MTTIQSESLEKFDRRQRLMAALQKFDSKQAPNRLQAILDVLAMEIQAAQRKHKPINSPHEGHSVILEELEELWDEIKADNGRTPDALYEALQTAAMCIRYIVDLS